MSPSKTNEIISIKDHCLEKPGAKTESRQQAEVFLLLQESLFWAYYLSASGTQRVWTQNTVIWSSRSASQFHPCWTRYLILLFPEYQRESLCEGRRIFLTSHGKALDSFPIQFLALRSGWRWAGPPCLSVSLIIWLSLAAHCIFWRNPSLYSFRQPFGLNRAS